MSYPICFVSLGPGDPELITLKGLKKLRQAEIIYCPATMNKNGQLLSRPVLLKNWESANPRSGSSRFR